MPRPPRSVPEGTPHHVTQRGVDRQDVFFTAGDRQRYLSLLDDNLADAGVRVLSYCLMSNHVHWVVAPERPGFIGDSVPASAWALRPIPERPAAAHGAFVAESLLFVRCVAGTLMGGVAVCRVESGAGADGAGGGPLCVVQRCGPSGRSADRGGAAGVGLDHLARRGRSGRLEGVAGGWIESR